MRKFIVTATIETSQGVEITARLGAYDDEEQAKRRSANPLQDEMFAYCLRYFNMRQINNIVSTFIAIEV
jgi:hypothetical protein